MNRCGEEINFAAALKNQGVKQMRKMSRRLQKILGIVVCVGFLVATTAAAGHAQTGKPKATKADGRPALTNVIFYHPDGYGMSHWNALRTLTVGPRGRINWDRLPHMAIYTDSMKDALTASSHGGATIHAYGVKVARDSFGLDRHSEITALSGRNMSIMEEAIEAGFATAFVQTGDLTEPGTAAFVASVKERDMHEEIARQVVESGVDVVLGGGERWLLPEGAKGRHGAGARKDGLNLIERARALGYTVVFNRDELMKLDPRTSRVLGVFAHGHTFNDRTEEDLRARGLPLYVAGAPTIAEMATVTLRILAENPKSRKKGMFIVAEEEGTDNFGNVANARGSFEAGKRADEAFGVFADFVERNPNTLLITAADSSAGGKSVLGEDAEGMARLAKDGRAGHGDINSGADGKYVRAPLDGIDGSNTPPFVSAPDKHGARMPFTIAWATRHDVSGGVLVRAKGLNAKKVSKMGIVDNTDIYHLMYYTLFNKWLPR